MDVKIQTIQIRDSMFCAIRLFVLSLGYHTDAQEKNVPVSIALHIRKMTAEKVRFEDRKKIVYTTMQQND